MVDVPENQTIPNKTIIVRLYLQFLCSYFFGHGPIVYE